MPTYTDKLSVSALVALKNLSPAEQLAIHDDIPKAMGGILVSVTKTPVNSLQVKMLEPGVERIDAFVKAIDRISHAYHASYTLNVGRTYISIHTPVKGVTIYKNKTAAIANISIHGSSEIP